MSMCSSTVCIASGQNGEVELIAPFEYPNGIAFSPEESVLYVANTRPGQYIMAFELDGNGDVVGMRHFADMPSEHADNGVPDGMKVDVEGTSVLHGTRRMLGVRPERRADWGDRAAGVPCELRLGRRGQPHDVLHVEYVDIQPANDDSGDADTGEVGKCQASAVRMSFDRFRTNRAFCPHPAPFEFEKAALLRD